MSGPRAPADAPPPVGRAWLDELRATMAGGPDAPDAPDRRRAVVAGWRALAADDRDSATEYLTGAELEWLGAVFDEALGVDGRARTEPGAWVDALASVAADIRYVRSRLEELAIFDWSSPALAQLEAAETLLDAVRAGLPASTSGEDAADTAILTGLAAAAGMIPDYPRAEETKGAEPTAPGDQRTGVLAALLPRLYAAADAGVAGLSTPELRALGSHPADVAVLVLIAGLAGRAERIGELEPASLDVPTEAAGLGTLAGEAAENSGMGTPECPEGDNTFRDGPGAPVEGPPANPGPRP